MMGYLRKVLACQALLTLVLIPEISTARASDSLRLRQLFSRPLILGASVSSGTFTTGPGTLATETVMGYDTSLNIARNGAEGRYFAHITPENLRAHSLIIALDFMFWDSLLTEIQASRAAIRNLIHSARRAKVPLVIGSVPLLHSRQVETTRLALNREIRSLCRRNQDCFLLDIERIHQVATDQGLVIGGYLYKFDLLTFDGIHVNSVGSRYLADQLLSLVR